MSDVRAAHEDAQRFRDWLVLVRQLLPLVGVPEYELEAMDDDIAAFDARIPTHMVCPRCASLFSGEHLADCSP